MSPRWERVLSGVALGATLMWALLSGIAHGILAVLVLALYRVCLFIAITVGAVVFALLRIESSESRNVPERDD
jgi:hypothetical protein